MYDANFPWTKENPPPPGTRIHNWTVSGPAVRRGSVVKVPCKCGGVNQTACGCIRYLTISELKRNTRGHCSKCNVRLRGREMRVTIFKNGGKDANP